MRIVAESLGVDHVIVKPSFDVLRQIFVASTEPDMYSPRALERASGICNSCMALAKGIALRIALERDISILAYGWSPGQIPLASTIFRMNPRMLRLMVQAAKAPLQSVVGSAAKMYFPQESQFEQIKAPLYNVSPIAFVDYTEQAALKHIQQLGWKRPEDTDPNSSNCLLNSFANKVHLEQMGYHPYAMELSGLVREGYMSREEALAKVATPGSQDMIESVERRLGIDHTEKVEPV
jgi:tRNA(Ile)-lysidine synthase TilS/MesJ